MSLWVDYGLSQSQLCFSSSSREDVYSVDYAAIDQHVDVFDEAPYEEAEEEMMIIKAENIGNCVKCPKEEEAAKTKMKTEKHSKQFRKAAKQKAREQRRKENQKRKLEKKEFQPFLFSCLPSDP